jgi:putative hydrolase of the HAD superfamily
MKDSNLLIIFDFDDTLVDTSETYWQARTGFIQALSDEGFDPEMILEEFEKVDASNIKTMNHSPYRYGKSMFITYNRLLEWCDREPSEKTLARIEAYGRTILERLPEPIPGARDLLRWASRHFKLALLTRGDEDFQMRKLQYVGFSHYFNLVRVVLRKDAHSFKQIMDELKYSPEKTWIIGDSIKSDINPGIETGANCLLYVYHHHDYSWLQEYGCPPIGPFYKVRSLTEIEPVLRTPSSFQMVKDFGHSALTVKDTTV